MEEGKQQQQQVQQHHDRRRQRDGSTERSHRETQHQPAFNTNVPLAYGYVDTSWEAHVTMLHHLNHHQYHRYVFLIASKPQTEEILEQYSVLIFRPKHHVDELSGVFFIRLCSTPCNQNFVFEHCLFFLPWSEKTDPATCATPLVCVCCTFSLFIKKKI